PVFKLYDSYKAAGIPLAFLALGFMSYLFMLLIFSFPYILSKIYFSKDIETMLSLPLASEEILASKFLSLTFSSLIYAVFLVIPIMFKFGFSEKMGPVYYIYGFLGLILLSMGIISLLAFVIIFLMRWVVRLPRIKNALQFLGMMLILIFSIGINYFIQSSLSGDPAEMIDQILKSSKGLLDSLLPGIPNLQWLLLAMENSGRLLGLGYFLLLFLATLLLVVVLIKLGAPFMRQGVLANTAIKEKKVRAKGKNKKRSVAVNLFKKELGELLRTPLYAFNTLGGGIILPIVMLIPLIAQGNIGFKELEMAREMIRTFPITSLDLILVSIAIGMVLGIFLGSIGNPVSSSFSREGKQIWIIKSLPILVKDQILGRLLVGMSFQLMLILPTLILIGLVLWPPIGAVLGILLGSLLSGLFISLLGLSVDARRPKLVWDNPQEAMKQNFNLVITMLTSWAYLGLVIFILVRIKIDYLENLPLIVGVIVFSQLLIDAGLYIYLNKTMQSSLLRMQY
ncbi:MAG TPA: hypothetical protein VFD08_01615, partial [Clostridia bacterium]|nr:hypothetical protein [Clostridia bacterium]